MVAIAAERVSKAYRLGTIGRASLQDDFERLWARLRGRPDPMEKVGVSGGARLVGHTFRALDDVSFEVTEGEAIGIIGRNGAGKSTLLKILSQITAPTTGCIRLRGRIASLLEVGTGFHPDLTGRENVFLNGAILGMTKAEIRSRFDEIVDFSECGAFIDTPVKRYSSGMYVRLAFAVAAYLDPEILVVDEVLAVGDAQFQRKCLGKMGEASRGGRTVLFVSHNMVAVQSLCSRALLLNEGRLVRDGDAGAVVTEYLREVCTREDMREWPAPEVGPGAEGLRIRRVAVRPRDPLVDGLIRMSSPVEIETEFWITKPGLRLHLTYHLLNEQGIVVLTTGSPAQVRRTGLHRASVVIPGNLLNSGYYSLRLLLVRDGNRVVYDQESFASFVVVDAEERQEACLGREPGVIQPVLHWTAEEVASIA